MVFRGTRGRSCRDNDDDDDQRIPREKLPSTMIPSKAMRGASAPKSRKKEASQCRAQVNPILSKARLSASATNCACVPPCLPAPVPTDHQCPPFLGCPLKHTTVPMVNTGRFVFLVLAYRLLVPLLSASAEPDHTTKQVAPLHLIGSSAAATQVAGSHTQLAYDSGWR
jgi:hypothetical protein